MMGAAWGAIAQAATQAITFERGVKESTIAAHENRDWQEEMSNTAHRREVADLRAAGLNPILAANSGAGVGSGAQANVPTGGGPNFSDMINSALALQQYKANKYKLKYEKGMQDLYDRNDDVKSFIDGANLGKSAGVSPNLGGVVGLQHSSARKQRSAGLERWKDQRKLNFDPSGNVKRRSNTGNIKE